MNKFALALASKQTEKKRREGGGGGGRRKQKVDEEIDNARFVNETIR